MNLTIDIHLENINNISMSFKNERAMIAIPFVILALLFAITAGAVSYTFISEMNKSELPVELEVSNENIPLSVLEASQSAQASLSALPTSAPLSTPKPKTAFEIIMERLNIFGSSKDEKNDTNEIKPASTNLTPPPPNPPTKITPPPPTSKESVTPPPPSNKSETPPPPPPSSVTTPPPPPSSHTPPPPPPPSSETPPPPPPPSSETPLPPPPSSETPPPPPPSSETPPPPSGN